jgi:putative addiction module CopG family antidote
MSIILTPQQEQFIQTKLQTGKYRTAEEVLEVALQLLEEHDQADPLHIDTLTREADAKRLQAYRETGHGIPQSHIAAWLSSVGTDDELPCPSAIADLVDTVLAVKWKGLILWGQRAVWSGERHR